MYNEEGEQEFHWNSCSPEPHRDLKKPSSGGNFNASTTRKTIYLCTDD